MTIRRVTKQAAAEVQARYPIVDLVDGWFFRYTEMTACNYLVEGTDLWGRTVCRNGGDPEALLAQCAQDAMQIEKEIKSAL